MFDIFAKLLSSIASFLFPLFASYKALKTSDPSQLTPWLMYWVVLACALLVESWTEWFLYWVPFYAYIRLMFLLYLVLPQTQGARVIYQTYLHPYLEENETQIEEFIASAHDRLKSAGIAYLKRAIDLLKANLFGMQTEEPTPPASPVGAQGYTQSLLARFSVPAARWTGSGNAGTDFYNLLASAVSAATGGGGVAGRPSKTEDVSFSGTLIPPTLRDPTEKRTFIATQKDKLNILLGALDNEARALEREDTIRARPRSSGLGLDGEDERAPSELSVGSGLSKSRSEADFEKIEAESGAEDESNLRRRPNAQTNQSGTWIPMPWSWGGAPPSAPSAPSEDDGHSSGFQKEQ